MACRVSPLLQIRVFNRGSEPYFGPGSDPGANWYSIIGNEYQFGTVSYQSGANTNGVPQTAPLVEYIGTDRMRTPTRDNSHDVPVGLVLRPFVVLKDVGDWQALPGDDGNWETRTAYTNPPVDMLVQDYQGVDDNGATTFSPWGQQSVDSHPRHPSFAFSLVPAAVTPEYDELIGDVPWCQVGWCSGKWAVRFFHNGSPILFRNNVPVMELGSPDVFRGGENPDTIVGIVRYQRGALLISLDNGASYDVWFEPDGTNVVAAPGHYEFTGTGMAAALGIHQVVYVDGTYTSPKMPMDRARTGTPVYSRFNYSASQPGTSASLISVAPTLDVSYMQYRVSLGTTAQTNSRFDYYYSPEAYVAELSFPVSPSFWWPIHDNGSIFEGRIKKLTIDKPFNLDEATCQWTGRWTVEEGGITGSVALRLVQVYGGWLYDDGTNDVDLLFTGYITNVSTTQINSGQIEVNFTASTTSLRPKRMQWRDSNASPYDGLTPNQCLLKWANSMGLDTRFIAYDTSGYGDNVALPNPYPEQPSYAPTPGEERWSFLNDIMEKCRLELGVLNNGSFQPFPIDTFIPTVYTWDANATNPTDSFIESCNYEQDILGTFTGVLVRGKTMFNEQMSAWIYDIDAEQNIFSDRFRPWPEWHIETIEEPVTRDWLDSACVGLAWKKITPKFDIALKGHLANFLSRRQTVWVRNTTVGATTLARVGVLSVKHVFDKNDPLQAYTEVNGIKVNFF